MMSSLIIENGYTAYIQTIYQYPTYDGLLEGLPTRSMNREIIKDAIEVAPKYTHESAVYLLDPLEQPLTYDGTYPFGQPATIPLITCMVRLESRQVHQDTDMDYSALTVIWFQEAYAFPIDVLVLDQIKQIPWSQVTNEYQY